LDAFLTLARADLAAAAPADAEPLASVLDLLQDAARTLGGWAEDAREAEAGATAFLYLAGVAATGWIALRLTGLADARLAAAGRFWLSDLVPRARLAHAEAVAGAARLEAFEVFRRV
jgi:hypothetical protein